MDYKKPCIVIYRAAGVPERLVKALCSGIEEELIPFEITQKANGDIPALAHEASEQSRLEVGVAVGADCGALTYRKLSPEKPLFLLGRQEMDEDELQKMGANAARLVKGIAFKE